MYIVGSIAREVAGCVCECVDVSVVMDALLGPRFNKKTNTTEPKMKNSKVFVTVTLL